MGFKPESQQPDFSKLEISLNNAKLQDKNNALYQTIKEIIHRIGQSRNLIIISIDDLEEEILLINKKLKSTFLTADNQVTLLPNSRQLIAGSGITFDDSIVNQRTVIAGAGSSGYWTPLTDGNVDETQLIFASGESIAVFVPA